MKRLEVFSDNEFELFVLQWAHGYLAQQYHEVQKWSGPGDKGRDVVGWYDPPGTNPRRWDNYQCKHYKDPIAPDDVWHEIGKLCYFVHIGEFSWPELYYFVSHKGAGPKLSGLIADPDQLKRELLAHWDDKCRNKIRETPVDLSHPLSDHIGKLDFSRIRILQPQALLDQHRQTPYHSLVFGTQLKPRPTPTAAPASVQTGEVLYVQRLIEAFEEFLKVPIGTPNNLPADMLAVFNHARTCFYSTESLKEFARDALSDDEYYLDLLEQFYQGILPTVLGVHAHGYARMSKAVDMAHVLQLAGNALREEVLPNDRAGFCHHLANADRVRWVKP